MQLAEQDELIWDDGSVNPEKCLDEFPLFTKVGPSLLLTLQIFHSTVLIDVALASTMKMLQSPASKPCSKGKPTGCELVQEL